MHQLSISDTKDFVKQIALIHREPVMIWGSPGIGKSEGIAQLAAEEPGDILLDTRLGQYDSVDLRGFPGVKNVTVPAHNLPGENLSVTALAALNRTVDLTVWYAPSTIPFKGNPKFEAVKGRIWLFLDELNAANNAVAGVAYQLINDRAVGEHQLLDNVIIICAGNREGDKGVTNKQPLPLSNRLVHCEAVVSVDDFCLYHQAKGTIPPIALAFYQFRKELLNTFDPSKPGIKAFSTPRTAEKAWKFFADPGMPEKIKNAAMAGAIGDGPAAEAIGFAKIWDTLKDYLPKIRKDPAGCDLPKTPGLRYAITMALSGEMSPKTVKDLHTFLQRLDPEFCVLAWQFAVKRDPAMFATPEFISFSKKYKAVFN